MNQMIEPLEGRRMMSTSPTLNITLADGLLTIENAQNVQVNQLTTGVEKQVVVTTQQPSDQLVFDPDAVVNRGTFLGVTKIVITGSNGDDIISLQDTDIPATISTGNGNDTITLFSSAPTSIIASSSAIVTINSGNGDDILILAADEDSPGSVVAVVDGGKGNDIVDLSGPISCTVQTSKGTDTVINEPSSV